MNRPSLIRTGALPILAERDFREIGEHGYAQNGVQEDAGLHRHEMEAPEDDIHSREQKERPGDVAMHSSASRGVRKAGRAHDQQGGNPEQQRELLPVGPDNESGDGEPPEQNSAGSSYLQVS